MHLLEKIGQDLSTKGSGQYHIKVSQLKETGFCESLDALFEQTKARHCYNSSTQTLHVEMPTWMHGSGFDWIRDWISEMRVQGYIGRGSLLPKPDTTLNGFMGRFSGSLKKPDCFIVPDGGIWPSVALEVGYPESYERLKEDADLLLEGSQGMIRVVILVKLAPLGRNETQCQTGFVEIHEYDHVSRSRRKRGGRKTLYPIPASHAQQCITLQWGDIVRDNMGLVLLNPAPPPLPLMLDDLRNFLDKELRRQIISREL